jgi:hypothetical protein
MRWRPRRKTQHQVSDTFGALTKLNGDSVEAFKSLEAIAESADTVVVGRVVATGPSRSFRAMETDAEVDTAWYAYVDVATDWSSPPIDMVRVEVFFPVKAQYDRFLRAELSSEPAMYFLRNKEQAALVAGWSTEAAAAESPYLMLVNQEQALLRNIGGRVHIVDLGSKDFPAPLNGTSFEDLVNQVKSIRGERS